jgi:pimeloyl-ACP methyl ester carboxylesterase
MTQSHPTFPAFSFTDAQQQVTASQVKYGDDPDQIIEFYGEVDSSRPTLVMIHGGYWRNIFDREHMRPLAVALAKAGHPVVLPEFRRVAGDPDTTLRDLTFALSTIEEKSVTLIGYSSGGHLALVLADKFPAVKKVITLAPVVDMVESQVRELGRGAVHEWLGRDAIERPELDPILLPPITAQSIILHGDSDERVPLDLTEKYVAKMRTFGKENLLEILSETSHFQMMDIPSKTFDALLRHIN